MNTTTTRPIPELLDHWRDYARAHDLTLLDVACGSPEYDHIVNLRAEVYGIAVADASDAIDRHSTLWLLMSGERPAGTLRCTYLRDGPLDCQAFMPAALLARYGDRIGSASRFCRSPSAPPLLRVGPFLIEHAWRAALEAGVRLDLMDVNVGFASYYERLGYRALPGTRFRHPLLDTPSEIMFLAADPARPGPLSRLFARVPDGLATEEVLETARAACPAPDEPARPAALVPGAVLSFSAGARGPRPDGYRVVAAQGGKLQRLLAHSPGARRLLTTAPLVINAYPAPVERLDGAVLVDTYGRQSALSSALMLAARHGMPAVVIGMPVATAQLLTAHLDAGHEVPSAVVLLLGGHVTPRSLEGYLVSRLAAAGSEAMVAFLYGVAEIEAALLVATERDDGGAPIYHPLDGRWSPEVRDGVLGFVAAPSREAWIATEERAVRRGGGVVVVNRPERLEPSVLSELESWDPARWRRRTGALAAVGDRFEAQLRPGVAVNGPDEVEHYEFARRHGFSWLDKPRWGRPGADEPNLQSSPQSRV